MVTTVDGSIDMEQTTLLGNDGIEAAAVVEPSVDSHNRQRPGAPHLASNLSHGQLDRDLFAFRRGGERTIEHRSLAPSKPLKTSNRYH